MDLSALGVFIAVAGVVWWTFRLPTDAPEVRAALRKAAQIVDVRTPREFEQDAVSGARNIPVDQMGRRFSELERDKPVVLYCASGRRSATAARMLRDAGFAEVVDAGPRGAWPDA